MCGPAMPPSSLPASPEDQPRLVTVAAVGVVGLVVGWAVAQASLERDRVGESVHGAHAAQEPLEPDRLAPSHRATTSPMSSLTNLRPPRRLLRAKRPVFRPRHRPCRRSPRSDPGRARRHPRNRGRFKPRPRNRGRMKRHHPAGQPPTDGAGSSLGGWRTSSAMEQKSTVGRFPAPATVPSSARCGAAFGPFRGVRPSR